MFVSNVFSRVIDVYISIGVSRVIDVYSLFHSLTV